MMDRASQGVLPDAGDIFRQTLEASLSSIASHASVPAEFRMKGTTCVGLVHAEGVVVATDGRATMGLMIGSDVFEKLFPVDRHSVVALAGSAGMAQLIARSLEAQLSFDQDCFESSYIPPKTKVGTLVNMVRQHAGALMSMGGLFSIFATYDTDHRDQKGRVFFIHTDGTQTPESEFECIGSGSPTAKPVISACLDMLGFPREKGMSERLTEELAQHLVVYGLQKAHERDAGTGGYVHMMCIRRDGVHKIPQEYIQRLIKDAREGKML